MSKNQKTRACNILFVRALHCADFVSRETLEAIMLDSVYASTAKTKTMGYVNDLKFYHNAKFEYKKNNKTVTHVKMLNAHMFNINTGFPLTSEEIASRNIAIEEIAKSLASEDSDVKMSETLKIETVNETVSQNEIVVMTSDNDVKMSDESLKIDESAIVSQDETIDDSAAIIARNEKRLAFAAKMKAARDAKKAKAA
jgi:hypothetical protein